MGFLEWGHTNFRNSGAKTMVSFFIYFLFLVHARNSMKTSSCFIFNISSRNSHTYNVHNREHVCAWVVVGLSRYPYSIYTTICIHIYCKPAMNFLYVHTNKPFHLPSLRTQACLLAQGIYSQALPGGQVPGQLLVPGKSGK